MGREKKITKMGTMMRGKELGRGEESCGGREKERRDEQSTAISNLTFALKALIT